jgi:hypothetical protein
MREQRWWTAHGDPTAISNRALTQQVRWFMTMRFLAFVLIAATITFAKQALRIPLRSALRLVRPDAIVRSSSAFLTSGHRIVSTAKGRKIGASRFLMRWSDGHIGLRRLPPAKP